jgi:ferredoxin
MKVHVDAGICAGFGACLGLSPEVFELHDDGYAIVRFNPVPPELEDVVRAAASQCPSCAITVSEDSAA